MNFNFLLETTLKWNMQFIVLKTKDAVHSGL
jgi:hypothetical protein